MQDLTLLAAIVATVLFAAMAAFQATLAAGAPVGAHVLGGRHSGVLPPRLRVFSGIAALLLVGFALVVLARAGVVGWPAGIAGLLIPASWVIAGFLVLNTLGNLASKSRFERTVLAATTAVLAVLCGVVALSCLRAQSNASKLPTNRRPAGHSAGLFAPRDVCNQSVGKTKGIRHSGSTATTRSAVWPEPRATAAKNAARRYDTMRESLHGQPVMRQAPRTRVSDASTISMVSGACMVVLLSTDRLPEVRSVGEAHVGASASSRHPRQHGQRHGFFGFGIRLTSPPLTLDDRPSALPLGPQRTRLR